MLTHTEETFRFLWRRFFLWLPLMLLIPLFAGFAPDPPEDRFKVLEDKLKALSAQVPGLNNSVDLAVNGVTIQEFVRGLAVANNLNVSVEPTLDTKLYDNFSGVKVIDVFIFLCSRYELDLKFIGNIIVFVKYTPPPVVQTVTRRMPIIIQNAVNKNLTLDLKNDSLSLVARELTRITGSNVVFAPDLTGKMLNGYITEQPLAQALEKIAFANELKITAAADNYFMIERGNTTAAQQQNGRNKTNTLPANTLLNTDNGLISVEANAAPIGELVHAVSAALKLQYFLFSDLKGNTTVSLRDATFDQFLSNVLNATDYTYRKKDGVYFIGDRNIEGLRITKLVQMKYRTVDKVVDYIPADLKKGVDAKAFPDLNGIILSGSEPRIQEIESFLREIDRVVPMVLVEVIIMDVSNTSSVAAGIQTGIGRPPANQGTITPGVDVTLNSDAINALISGINGFGILNLGFVAPSFYARLTALETQGMLKIRSTPKLATLNGSEAKMSIGRTEYYLEQTNNLVTGQTPQFISTNVFKPITADFSLSITPMVSGDEQVTLSISVKQSSFTQRVSETGPPGTTQRSFESVVRVKNEEMVLLGGLEESNINEAGSGTPFLSRIPGLKWLFGSRSRSKSRTKLSVLVRPTVIY
ncbi:MAG: type II secretion system protein GspD [Bacteroidetes bacterium]|nr:type II secretion system protein GspD [Bacteroidota bacterium]